MVRSSGAIPVLTLVAMATSAAAFAPTTFSGRTSSAVDAMSKSVPFLLEPENTKGMVGDVGFDPFGLSDKFDIKWMRESELKHGRACMLATLGFVVQQFVTIPGYTHVDDSNLGPTVVGASAMLQIVVWCGVIEWWTNKGNVTYENMFSDSERVPGNLGFDPLGLGKNKSAEDMEKLELQEIKNGRLAMLAIGGMIHHNWITGDALF
jgi:light-harvesting complex I chlorophyll a/b binding protein 4